MTIDVSKQVAHLHINFDQGIQDFDSIPVTNGLECNNPGKKDPAPYGPILKECSRHEIHPLSRIAMVRSCRPMVAFVRQYCTRLNKLKTNR